MEETRCLLCDLQEVRLGEEGCLLLFRVFMVLGFWGLWFRMLG